MTETNGSIWTWLLVLHLLAYTLPYPFPILTINFFCILFKGPPWASKYGLVCCLCMKFPCDWFWVDAWHHFLLGLSGFINLQSWKQREKRKIRKLCDFNFHPFGTSIYSYGYSSFFKSIISISVNCETCFEVWTIWAFKEFRTKLAWIVNTTADAFIGACDSFIVGLLPHFKYGWSGHSNDAHAMTLHFLSSLSQFPFIYNIHPSGYIACVCDPILMPNIIRSKLQSKINPLITFFLFP